MTKKRIAVIICILLTLLTGCAARNAEAAVPESRDSDFEASTEQEQLADNAETEAPDGESPAPEEALPETVLSSFSTELRDLCPGCFCRNHRHLTRKQHENCLSAF